MVLTNKPHMGRKEANAFEAVDLSEIRGHDEPQR